MTGHLIYTRSWFEMGSKSQNAGTFTVELTEGIFGAQSDEIVYNKLNPMFAAVPESLAPLNSGKSMLRVFHPLPDTTIISRNWFVTDKITGRGPVPYAFSLIFRGSSNDIFLQNPEKAFSPDAAEPYDSFCDRVAPDAPVAISREYDPKKGDYLSPFLFGRNDWINELGFNQELFAGYYINLCKAICGKANSRVGTVLPEGGNSELLILATLSLLPMCMKKKFSAVSRWKGMMDGSAGGAISSLHLICCFGMPPLSETKFPVVDLTGAGNHENIDIADRSYADWVWENIDNKAAITGFDRFLTENFGSVSDKMPYMVIENCFMLWNVFVNQKKVLDFKLAAITMKLITDSFAKNFSKFPFICDRIQDCLIIIREELAKNLHADLAPSVIQAICLLAGNGEMDAHETVSDIHNYFCGKSDWKRASITIAYYSSLLERPDIAADTEKLCCEMLLGHLTSTDQGIAKTARSTIEKYCRRLRTIILSGGASAEASLAKYRSAMLALYSAAGGRLGGMIFDLPAQGGMDANRESNGSIRQGAGIDAAARFARLMEFDITSLGYVPTQARWVDSLKWLKPLSQDENGKAQIIELYRLYYDSIPAGQKQIYILNGNKQQRELLLRLIRTYEHIKKDIEQVLGRCIYEDLNKAGPALDSDETWKKVSTWLDRLDTLEFTIYDRIYPLIRQIVSLDLDNLLDISGSVSADSIQTIARLYDSAEPQLADRLNIMRMIDTAAVAGDVEKKPGYGIRHFDIHEALECYNRMNYWYEKSFSDPAGWALFMLAATVGSAGFNVWEFIKMCREKNETASETICPQDMVCVFAALKHLEGYSDEYRMELAARFREMISSALSEDNAEDIFINGNVTKAFSGLSPSTIKDDIGKTIAERLYQNKDISTGIRDTYYRIRHKPGWISSTLKAKKRNKKPENSKSH